MNPTNMTIAMCIVMSIGMLSVLYVLIRALATHDEPTLQGSFSSDWGRHR